MTKDLILRIRLSELERNLKQVRNVKQALDRRHNDIDKLNDVLSEAAEPIGSQAKKSVRELLNDIYDELNKEKSRLRRLKQAQRTQRVIELENLQRAIDSADKALKRLDEADTILSEMKNRLADFPDPKEGEVSYGVTVKEINEYAEKELDHIKLDVSALDRLQRFQLEDASKDSNAESPPRDICTLWQDYSNKSERLYRELFTDYVDFLRGLAVRDSHMDKGLSQLADGIFTFNIMIALERSLTIPARREAMNRTVSRIVRFTFPGWSLWTIPLTAHEFGYFVNDKKRFLEFINKRAGDDEVKRRHLEHYVADAFATYTMGPSYACVEILLRFDPQAAQEDKIIEKPTRDFQPSYAKRAEVIFGILDWMNKQEGLVNPYGEVAGDLKKIWQQAQKACLQNGSAGQMSLEVQQELKNIIDELKIPLQRDASSYEAGNWEKSVMELREKFLATSEVTMEIPVSEYNLRDVLNAAWLARMKDWRHVETINTRAHDACNRFLEGRKEGRGGEFPGGRS